MGDPVTYRDTLLDYLAALRAQHGKDGIVLNNHVTTVDIVLTETRLAVLAESQGNLAESGRFFARTAAGGASDPRLGGHETPCRLFNLDIRRKFCSLPMR
jgi:hypothetical protein